MEMVRMKDGSRKLLSSMILKEITHQKAFRSLTLTF